MAKVKFTRDIIGSPNGIIVKEYKAEQIVSDAELGNYLLEVWKEAGIIEVVKGKGEDADAEGEEDKPEDKDKDNDDELTEEKIGELVYEANEILQQEKVSDEDVAKLKEIGIELKIEGMQTSKKPQTIVDKINKYLDEYYAEEEENQDADAVKEAEAEAEGEGEGEDIPEA